MGGGKNVVHWDRFFHAGVIALTDDVHECWRPASTTSEVATVLTEEDRLESNSSPPNHRSVLEESSVTTRTTTTARTPVSSLLLGVRVDGGVEGVGLFLLLWLSPVLPYFLAPWGRFSPLAGGNIKIRLYAPKTDDFNTKISIIFWEMARSPYRQVGPVWPVPHA